ncbi:MAG: LTA synthase family protein [Oscillospiraceae bacterium]|nr:LTA synthase family protein [Oscillospiraceae bacterium]
MSAEPSSSASAKRPPQTRKPLRRCLEALLLLCAMFLQLWQLQCSGLPALNQVLRLSLPVILLNLALLLALSLAARLLLQHWHWALLLSALLCTLWSVVNYFVVKYHGSPLFFSEFRNFSTAMNVAGAYSYAWEPRVLVLAGLGAAQALAALLIRLLRGREPFFTRRRLLWNLGALLGCCAGLYLLLFVICWPKPRLTMFWTWNTGVEEYGYPCAIVEDVDRSANAIDRPEGYDPAHLDALEPAPARKPERCPDLIVIVNESFAELRELVDFSADADYLEGFTGQAGGICGKLVITSAGGGTNNTEYELLSSNSMHLMHMAAPFNYVNLNLETKNLVSYLKPLGYRSLALHCENGTNYSRNRGYPALGFDRVVMGNENFTFNRSGNRRWLDADLYRDMIRYYNEMEEGPRLVYVLTYQNHGGYEQNEDSLDSVHAEGDFGDYADDVNEYLSSLRLSAQAYGELLDYFRGVERPVMILMLGDHLPSFTQHAPFVPEPAPDGAEEAEEDPELEIRKRTVPYALWANFPVEYPADLERATLTDLTPLLLRTAGLPLSRYHELLLQLHALMPERTLNGYYRDAEGRLGRLDESCPWYELLQTYYEMEYNALQGGSEYRKALFELPAQLN